MSRRPHFRYAGYIDIFCTFTALKGASTTGPWGLSKRIYTCWQRLLQQSKRLWHGLQAQAAEDKERVDKLKKDMPPISQSAAKEAKAKHQRARSPYQFFCASQRDSMKASNPDAGFGDIAKLLAGMHACSCEMKSNVLVQSYHTTYFVCGLSANGRLRRPACFRVCMPRSQLHPIAILVHA